MMSSTTISTGWNFSNSYTSLSDKLFALTLPTPVADPSIVVLNQRLATALGLDFSQLSPAEKAAIFSGNALPPGAQPIAQAYAGHQFGQFNVLGDGRAILLGEQIAPDGQRFDIQLKGAGPSLYSRRGDGRATLSAMLREYLMSEAMFHLGIPTTGSLAVVATGENVARETLQPGAVLTRVASSHIRVGSFEYVSRFHDKAILQAYTDYTIQRHYAHLMETENRALAFLEAVLERQISLVTHWMRVGFIHGVMNTDNMSIAGETIDYGPCAFMNRYHPQTAYSSIDYQGRYAFGNQPPIAQWNLVRLAGSLLPLIAEEPEKAIELAQPIINKFPGLYEAAWLAMMRNKLGWLGEMSDDKALIDSLLQWMETENADYTNTFLLLQGQLGHTGPSNDQFTTAQLMDDYAVLEMGPNRERAYDEEGLKSWLLQWKERLTANGQNPVAALALMQANNPAFIPRNHNVEASLAAAQQGDDALFHTLLDVLAKPYHQQPAYRAYQMPPVDDESSYKTFCNT